MPIDRCFCLTQPAGNPKTGSAPDAVPIDILISVSTWSKSPGPDSRLSLRGHAEASGSIPGFVRGALPHALWRIRRQQALWPETKTFLFHRGSGAGEKADVAPRECVLLSNREPWLCEIATGQAAYNRPLKRVRILHALRALVMLGPQNEADKIEGLAFR